MSLLLRRDFHRWSRWYPKRWCERNGAAMLGTFLDVADAEGRGRLTGGEKAAMVVGGLTARAEAVVPRAVQSVVAAIFVGLLGALGLFAGVVLEWAPWAGAARAQIIAPFATMNGLVFGPFLSPFALVAAAGVTAMLASLVAPDWLYRGLLAATVVGGLIVAVMGHDGAGGFVFLHAAPAFFTCVLAALAVLSARPPRTAVLISGGVWLMVLVVSPSLFGPLPLSHLVSGYPYGASIIFDDVIQPALTYFGCLLALLTAAILLALHRAGLAAIILLASFPFFLLSTVHGWSGRAPMYVVILIAAFAIAAAIAIARSATHRDAVLSDDRSQLLTEP